MKNLKKFLVEAKQNTYASGKSIYKKKKSDGSVVFEYKSGNYTYYDRYFGSNPFIGREAVYVREKLIWEMFYYGSVLDNKENVNTIYNFLKKALMEITENTPYRGKNFYSGGDFSYKNKFNEIDNSFYGTEFIYFKESCVYKAYYRGGLVLEG